jgi:murein DD-endopeptidase MepM/ murein hydrolase activator NlpD
MAAAVANEVQRGIQPDEIRRYVLRRVGEQRAPIALRCAQAAALHWQLLLSRLPPEFDKERVWLLPVNEVDKNRAEWLGQFAVALGALALDDGYRVLMFGWSVGEPEYGHWLEPSMLAYLALCAQYPDRLGVAMHEYSLNPNDIEDAYPYLVGRWRFLMDACDEADVPYPTTLISEWGWAYDMTPGTEEALHDIAWANEEYQHPDILGAATWYRGSDDGGIANRVQKVIAPVTEMALAYEPDQPLPVPDPEPTETLEEFLWRQSVEEQIARGIPLNPAAALQKEIFAAGLVPVHRERAPAFEGQAYTIQAAESLDGVTPRRVYVWQAGKPTWHFTDPAKKPGDPLTGLVLGPLFRVSYVLTSPFDAPRDYANKKHEGADYDIIGGPADSKGPVLCAYPGTVTAAGLSSGAYGYRVVVRCIYNGETFHVWYAHMDNVQVSVGQTVQRGQPVGELGATGGNWPEHVHINLQHNGTGLDGYVVTKVRDPHPFMVMEPEPAPGGELVDMLSFMRADPDAWRVVRHPDGSGEDFRDWHDGQWWAMQKNQLAEWWFYDDDYIYLREDTSPAPADDGTERCYKVTPGRWCRRFQRVGETFDDGGHTVQFYSKATCQPHEQNSGQARNVTAVLSVRRPYTFNKYGQNLTLDEVLFVQGNTETQVFARHQGRPLGRVAWSSPWGESEIVELYFDRGRLAKAPARCCP